MATRVYLKINGIDFTGQLLYPYEIQRNKLWDSDGRVMSGKMSATLIGIFPKLVLQFAPKNQSEVTSIMTQLDKSAQSIQYVDPKSDTLKTLGTYTSDYTVTSNSLGQYDEIKVSFISLEKE